MKLTSVKIIQCSIIIQVKMQVQNNIIILEPVLQERRIRQEIAALEKDTGYKLRVLAQNYPDTPGMAAKVLFKFLSFF